jgi:hypothetical protein
MMYDILGSGRGSAYDNLYIASGVKSPSSEVSAVNTG